MTTKTLTGTYTAGYTLSAAYSGLIIGASASVTGATGAAGQNSTTGNGGTGGLGGIGVLANAQVSVVSNGMVVGGLGGAGGAAYFTSGYPHGGAGGAGGAGFDLAGGGTIMIAGGTDAGGQGGAGGSGAVGGQGGQGGAGVLAGAQASLISNGAVLGGLGGAGGYGPYDGWYGGAGGAGIDLADGGSVTLASGKVGGGQGGAGGAGNLGDTGGQGGAGIEADAQVSIVVDGSVVGGVGGAGGAGIDKRGIFGLGGKGGAGGAGLELGGGGSVTISGGGIVGGQGGVGGNATHFSGKGGQGGAGIVLADGGSLTVAGGAVTGGQGGAGGVGGFMFNGYGGAGVDLADGGTFTNLGAIAGGAAGGAKTRAGYGALLAVGGAVINGGAADPSATIAGSIGVECIGPFSPSTVVNFGTIEGVYVGVDFGLDAEDGSRSRGSVVNGSATDGTALIGASTGYGIDLYLDSTVTNFGTIAGAPRHASIVMRSPGDKLIAEAGSKFVGIVEGIGVFGAFAQSTLELAGGAGFISDLGVTAALSGAASATVTGFGAYVIDAGGSWTFRGQDVLKTPQNLSISGATSWDAVAGDHQRLSGAVSVTATGSINSRGAAALVMNGVAIANAGLIEATAGGVVIVSKTTIDNGGEVISAGTGSKVRLDTADVEGGSLTTAGTGIIEFAGGPSILDGTAAPIADDARVLLYNGTTLTAEGSIGGKGLTILDASTLQTVLMIAAEGATLSGGGVLKMGDSAANEIIGASGTATLVNAGDRIYGAGALGAGQLTLVNQAGGVIQGIGTVGLTIDTGANTIVNAGLIQADGYAVTVDSAIANTGRLVALNGVLTLAGAVSGTGTAYVKAGTVDAEAAFGQNVVFIGGGTLELAQSQAYAGRIVGFSATGGTSLDLGDIGFVSAGEATFSGTASSGVLTVSDGTHTAHITLVGDYTGAAFVASSDGHGGVSVVGGVAAPQAFAAAMAAMGAGAAASAPVANQAHDPLTPVLAAGR